MRSTHRLSSILRGSTLRKDNRGNVMPIAAAGMVVAMALVGSGVDMSRAYMVKSRLQAACDAGVLAGRRSVISDGFDDKAIANAGNYFKANFNDRQQNTHDTVFSAVSTDEGKTINGTATTQVDTAVMRVFTFNKFNLRVNCSSTMGVGNSDIVMVLDTTGSMGDQVALDPSKPDDKVQKIVALRSAMKKFYDTVEASADGSNARVRYGFVPYSSSVNVGKLIYKQNPKYIVDTWHYQSRWPKTNSDANDTYGSPVTTYGRAIATLGVIGNEVRYDAATEYSSSSTCNTQYKALNKTAQWSDVGDEPLGDPQTVVAGKKRVTTTTLSSVRQSKPVYKCVSYKNNQNKTRYYVAYNNTFQIINQYQYDTEYALISNTLNGVFDHWVYEDRYVDVSLYKTAVATSIANADSNAGMVNYTWKGCIEETQTENDDEFGYSPIIGMIPSKAWDLNIDHTPNINKEETKWRPMWPEITYLRGTYERVNNKDVFRIGGDPIYSQGQRASSYCPSEAQLLTAMSGAAGKTAFYGYADKLKAEGSTYHDLGMIWGGRLSSPDGIFSANVTDTPQNGGAVSRHLIFMTDGIMDPSNTIQTSYGVEFYDRRITNDGSTEDDARHSARFLAVCEAVKAKGIRVWVIAFGTTLSTNLQQCASDESAFTANDAGSLNTAFQEIAKQVGELRVSQ